MDGVVSDTQILHSQSESQLLSNYGINLSPAEITKRFAGMKTSEFFGELLKEKNIKINLTSLIDKKWQKMIELAQKSVSPMPGAINLINQFLKDGLKLGLASASTLKYIKIVLLKLNLENKFQTVVSADEVKRGKPEPDIFLKTAKKLFLKPNECVVIEDGISGMIAAKRAKMKCVGLTTDEKQNNYPADIIVKSLNELTIEKILRI